MTSNKPNGIQVIARSAAVLRALGQSPEGLSLGQIAHVVELPRSTVQRIVAALSAEGFVTIGKVGGSIRLGPEIQALAQASAQDTKDVLRPILEQIANETGETVDLAVMEGERMLFVDQVVGRQRLRTVSSIGESFPLTTTANGKAALACLDEAHAARLAISEYERMPDTSGSLPELLADVQEIRNGALATDEDSHTEGVSALGFAIKDSRGQIFAISIPVPSARYRRIKSDLSSVLNRHRSTLPQG